MYLNVQNELNTVKTVLHRAIQSKLLFSLPLLLMAQRQWIARHFSSFCLDLHHLEREVEGQEVRKRQKHLS